LLGDQPRSDVRDAGAILSVSVAGIRDMRASAERIRSMGHGA
jgi:hypothetical protein